MATAKKVTAKKVTAKTVTAKTVTAKKPAKTPAKPAGKLTVKVKDPKVEATKRNEPYVNIISIDVDPENVGQGAFELDWNEQFITKLLRAGYAGKTDADIVDRWFQDVCRNVVLETFEQYEANNPRPTSGVNRVNLGDGRSEVS
jgi:hypothetical protein